MSIPGMSGPRRLQPRPWDSTAYLLNSLRSELWKVISQELMGREGTVVLDMGCGERPYEPLVTKAGGKYVGVDVEGNPRADYTHASDEPAPLTDGCADVVLSTQVLEHVVNVDSYLKECWRLLQPEGVLVICTHGFWNYHPYPVDVRRWTCWGLKSEIESAGFRVESQSAHQGPLAYTTQLRLQLLRGFLWKFGLPGRFLAHVASFFAQPLMWLEDRITPRKVFDENAAIYLVTARKPSEPNVR